MKIIFKTSVLLIFILVLVGPNLAYAAEVDCAAIKQDPGKCAALEEICGPCPALSGEQGAASLENPLGQGITPAKLYGQLIFSFMGFSGAIALLMFIIGGFQWMTAGGNAEKVKKGRDTLMWAVLGLIMIFSSYAILRAIFETLRF